MIKHLPRMWEIRVQSLGQEDLLEKEMATYSSILAWKIQRNLVGYSPWGHKESDTTERLHFTLPDVKIIEFKCQILGWLKSIFMFSSNILHVMILTGK